MRGTILHRPDATRFVARLLPVIALLALGCASANKLAKQSETDLTAGNLDAAYQHALKAVDKSPRNARARSAYTAAATRMVEDRKARILSIAAADTLAAAERVLDLSQLRGEILAHGVTLPDDPTFDRAESAIRLGAAEYHYAAAEHALTQGSPKRAWMEFKVCQRYAPGYRDVTQRMDQAHAEATARVAILPFADQVEVPGLSRQLADRMFNEVSRHVQPGEFEFTRLVDPGQVYGNITVSELDRIDRDAAIRIGRKLGADEVVTGRFYGMRSSTNTADVRQSIYRRETFRDTAGVRRERFVEQEFHAVERERSVTVRYDLEVVDTGSEQTLSSYSDKVDGYARVVFTDFRATGDCDQYRLYPPGLKDSDPDRARDIDREWKRHFGTWTLGSLLEKSRNDHSRTRYTSGDRGSFFGDCHERPVWLGGLPNDNDMASISLDVVWQPVLGMLRELDPK
jgi:hypothetical protein